MDELRASDTIEMRSLYTFNNISRMPKPAQWSLAKHVRGQAANAWRRAGVPRLDGRWDFVVYTAVRTGSGIAPDADSGMWVAKRILDGAVDAGVIPDDSPRFVAGVHVHAAAYLALSCRVSYVGSFESPRERTLDIHV